MTRVPRIEALDFIRGVAVMGILVANLPGFALPEAGYFSPRAWGGTAPADLAAWFATFVLVEGKMRGLFTMLFGASTLLVIDRARAAGDSAAQVHFARMATLFAIGCAHLYLLWWGDILAHYALVGAIAYLFAGLPTRWLLAAGAAMLAAQLLVAGQGLALLLDAAARDTPARVATWQAFVEGFGRPAAAVLSAQIDATRGGFWPGVAWRWSDQPTPLAVLPILGSDTLAAMLFGMAAYRSGFLAGGWPRARYRRWAAWSLATTLPVYALVGMLELRHGFDLRWVYVASMIVTPALRMVTAAGYAALLMLAMRPGGRLTARVAAAGQAAFTNYLGTTLAMTAIFSGWGLGLFARVGRAELYLLAPPVWLAMLAWSRPWLARYRYGPLEWLWRSLARLAWQPMRR